ncbi:MAG: NAD-dependent malic enzyme [Myxococcota bacterium]
MRHSEKQVRILRVWVRDEPGHLGQVTSAIGATGANIGDVVRVRSAGEYHVREIEVHVEGDAQLEHLLRDVSRLDGIRIESVFDPVLRVHRGGKIAMRSRVPVERQSDVRMIYTPGVATVSEEIHRHPERVYDYTSLGRTVAIVTNGTAVLGLGNIGVHAALPVMEGKAVLLERLAGLSGVPILIPSREVETVVETVIQIAPSFGAIQLEDIAAPECFEIESRLDRELPIPVLHDDQHGTAVVALAALLNVTRELGAVLEDLEVGIVGLGAAGMGIGKLLRSYGIKVLIGTDLKRSALRRFETIGGEPADLRRVMAEARVVIATTGVAGLISPEWVREGQILLALSNPEPEIQPGLALQAGAAFAVDGRSVNNALGFPGLFLGALRARVHRFSAAMLLGAARTIARFAEPGALVPALLHPEVHGAVADAVEKAARAESRGRSEP